MLDLARGNFYEPQRGAVTFLCEKVPQDAV